jgi:hypothetical protein
MDDQVKFSERAAAVTIEDWHRKLELIARTMYPDCATLA